MPKQIIYDTEEKILGQLISAFRDQIDEIRKLMGPITSKFPVICSDASILRYLRARNLNTKKASKMLKETLKWRLEHKPDKIQWVFTL